MYKGIRCLVIGDVESYVSIQFVAIYVDIQYSLSDSSPFFLRDCERDKCLKRAFIILYVVYISLLLSSIYNHRLRSVWSRWRKRKDAAPPFPIRAVPSSWGTPPTSSALE
jgi:hypothetical protein